MSSCFLAFKPANMHATAARAARPADWNTQYWKKAAECMGGSLTGFGRRWRPRQKDEAVRKRKLGPNPLDFHRRQTNIRIAYRLPQPTNRTVPP